VWFLEKRSKDQRFDEENDRKSLECEVLYCLVSVAMESVKRVAGPSLKDFK
jgi:hypothetical protein